MKTPTIPPAHISPWLGADQQDLEEGHQEGWAQGRLEAQLGIREALGVIAVLAALLVVREEVPTRPSNPGPGSKMTVANVCNVNLEGPCIVRGKVEVEDEHRLLLRNPSQNTAYIEIPVCEGYSIGYGPWPAVWASGKAGWYEINPARMYKEMYEHMCEGITLYYKIIDAYDSLERNFVKAKRYKALQTPIEKVLFKYSVAIGDGATHDEVESRCQKHAPFLLAHFDQENDFKWKTTTFRKWLTEENESLVQKLDEAKKKGPAAPAPAPAEPPAADPADLKEESNDSAHDSPQRQSVVTDRTRRSKSRASRQSAEEDIGMEDVQPAPPRRSETYIPPPVIPSWRSAQSSVPSGPTPGDQSSPAPTQPQDPVKFLLEILEEILEAHGGDPQTIRDGKLHTDMYMRCTIKQYSAAREITHFYSRPLLEQLPQKWNSSPFWGWLTSVVDQPWEPKLLTKDQIPDQCKRRKRKDKSVSKGKEAKEPEIVPRGAGKRWPPTPRPAVLRPGTGAKRPATYHSDDDDERARKAARTSQDLEEENEEDSDSDSDSDLDSDADDTGEAADVAMGSDAALATPTPAPPMEIARLVVRHEKIPSMSPSGPNGTWRCEEDGCNYIVRSAEEPEGKDLIAKHFQYHMAQVEKMNLALSEGTRGHMPINHLLEKIRKKGEEANKKEQRHVDGISAPQPIKRKLIV
ncbi:hypothetical protein J7T55_004667 [Diaporthe amygdali]|uniref:uncharacterized protein n=1 Tax=Phomopsis amygdali TaxID=1214568 RepID=UPI0022FE45D0|nr:uncharacterized protein J7T55_004667 [Diaporthe amygdali]KAJ0114925.1 hypothetical protein J7T55_004667 [Diaporthe amygdali]